MRFFYLLLFFILSLNANDLKEYYKLKKLDIEDKFCLLKSANKCYSKKLTYPVEDILNLSRVKPLLNYIKERKDSFYKKSAKNFLKDIKKDEFFADEWYEYETVSLYNYLKGFLTIKDEYNSYRGGAHGSYGIYFKNFYKIKELKLKTIFGNKEKEFNALALEVYKEQKGLMPNDSLEKDGWFNNNFTLVENFAFNDNAIVFLYNPYDIKAYAYGITTFNIPYYRLKNILNESSVIYPLIKKSKSPKLLKKEIDLNIFSNQGKVELIFDKSTMSLEVKLSLEKNYKEVWLSISMPQFKSKKNLKKLYNLNFNSFKLYDIKNKIYNKKLKKAINAKYLLAEAYAKEFKSYDKYSFSLKIMKPLKKLYLNIRVTARDKSGKIINLLGEYENLIKDQQDFWAKRVIFYLGD